MAVAEYSSEADMIEAYRDIKRRFYPAQPRSGRTLPELTPPVLMRPAKGTGIRRKPRDLLLVAKTEAEGAKNLPRSQWGEILFEVAEQHDLDPEDILGPRRPQFISKARHEVMYRMRTETCMSYPEIAWRLGRMDHVSVIRGVRKHMMRMQGLNV